MEREHIEWCKRLFGMLAERGVWGVPRAGLLFQRQGEELVLIDQMPWVPGMAESGDPDHQDAVNWSRYQDDEFRLAVEHFGAAGITVRRQEGGVPC